jgi:dUTP pyrophosphatase
VENAPSFLTKPQLLDLLAKPKPLVEGLLDPQVQVQPAGIDLSLQKIYSMNTAASIGFTQAETTLPEYEAMTFDNDDKVFLSPGPYKVVLNEVVNIPRNVVGIARPRSTICRSGATVGTALWDPGYSGRSEVLLIVHNPNGLTISRNARVIQLCFWELAVPLDDGQGYSGRYQLENIVS